MVKDVLPDVPLRLLEVFASMMRAETTTEAAAMLGLSQPAVSQGLRQLEKLLGLTLFERLHRRLIPTPEARMLYSEIESMTTLVRSFALRARDLQQGMVGRLRVIATPPVGNTLGARALATFMRDRPNLSISFNVHRRVASVIEAVQNGSAEIGLALITAKPVSVNVEIIKRSSMVVVVDETDDLAGERIISAKALAQGAFIGLEIDSAIGMKVRSAFEQTTSPYTPTVEVGNNLTAITLANAGMGAAIVDPYTARHYAAPRMRIRPFIPNCELYVAVFTRRGVPHSSIVRSFMDEVSRQFMNFDETGDTIPL